MFTVLISLVSSLHLVLARGTSAGCQGSGACPSEEEEHCYKNMCLNAKEVMQVAFEFGNIKLYKFDIS